MKRGSSEMLKQYKSRIEINAGIISVTRAEGLVKVKKT